MKSNPERSEFDSPRRIHTHPMRYSYSKKSVLAVFRASVLVLLYALLFTRYLGADLYFSFDYRHYISFFEALNGLAFPDLIRGVHVDAPGIYVVVEGTHLLFEVGFVSLSWVLVALFDSPSTVYALIATTSVVTRMVLLDRMGVSWPINLLLSAYSLTLFESNALRLGCAVTCLLIMVYMMRRAKTPLAAIVAAAFSLSFHAQTAFFCVFIIPLFYGYRFYAHRGIGLLLAAAALIVVSLAFVANAGAIDSQKLADYSGREATAGGITVVSLLGAAVIFSSLWFVMVRKRATYAANFADYRVRIWVAVVLATLPSLVVLALATELGSVGGRLWQASFVVLCTVAWADSLRHELSQTLVVRAVMALLLLVSSVNVIYRYPLSNFFVPFAPYAQVY